MKKIIVTLVFVLPFSLQANEISTEETVSFLQGKLNVQKKTDHGDYRKFTTIQSFIDDENCEFTIRVIYKGMEKINDKNGGVYGKSIREINFSAKDLDYTKVFHDKANSLVSVVTIGTRENKKKVTYKDYYYEPHSKKNYCKHEEWASLKTINTNECVQVWNEDEVMIPMILGPEKENRPRVIKAMKHLIKSCGGKKELF